jgi:hypothetical protein
MTRTNLILAAAIGALAAAPAPAATPPSPPVFWAGCAGALAVKSQRSDQAAAPGIAGQARRALAQAKLAANPDKLTPAQIDGVAIAAGRSFKTELAANPAREPAFEKAVQVCTAALAKLPG